MNRKNCGHEVPPCSGTSLHPHHALCVVLDVEANVSNRLIIGGTYPMCRHRTRASSFALWSRLDPCEWRQRCHRPSRRDLRLYGEPSARQYSGGVDDSMIVEQLRALADPVRLAIVRELRGGTRCACELAQVAEVSSPLLSHHLKVLRTAQLITGAKRGRWIDYTLDEAALR